MYVWGTYVLGKRALLRGCGPIFLSLWGTFWGTFLGPSILCSGVLPAQNSTRTEQLCADATLVLHASTRVEEAAGSVRPRMSTRLLRACDLCDPSACGDAQERNGVELGD